MGTTEIILIIVIVLCVSAFAIIGFANGKKIKESLKPKTEEKNNEKEIKQTKKIIKENSIEVENYIKQVVLNDELKPKNEEVILKEVTLEEVLENEEEDLKQQAIVLGHKKQEVHILDNDADEINNNSFNTVSQIINEIDEESFNAISEESSDFEVEEIDKIKSLKNEIHNLSKEAKIVMISGVLNKDDK